MGGGKCGTGLRNFLYRFNCEMLSGPPSGGHRRGGRGCHSSTLPPLTLCISTWVACLALLMQSIVTCPSTPALLAATGPWCSCPLAPRGEENNSDSLPRVQRALQGVLTCPLLRWAPATPPLPPLLGACSGASPGLSVHL